MKEAMTYQEFIESKKHRGSDHGIDLNYTNDRLFDFQLHVLKYAVKKGRCAVFMDTGLGKTLIELCIAVNYYQHTEKPVLIMCPLAVAFQVTKEAERFGIDDVAYSKNGKIESKIVICNYERLQYFNASDFECVILDESSILKNYDGATRNHIDYFLKKVKYRFLFTATPSPNDYIELGTSSEVLGYMGYNDMLSKFFKNNQNTSKLTSVQEARQGLKFYLKAHAEDDFWDWVSSWSISLRKPSDIGYSDELHHLPELVQNFHLVENVEPLIVDNQINLFRMEAQTFKEIKSEVRQTIEARCEKALELSSIHDTSVIWVNLNDESKMISKELGYVEIEGSMSIDKKEDILLSFSNGDIKKLVTKTTITAFGLNWQHCNHTVFFPTYSYEQYYQAIRRFYRFGQKRQVICDLVISDGQTKIMKAIQSKKNKADEMFSKIVGKTTEQKINQKRTSNYVKPKFI